MDGVDAALVRLGDGPPEVLATHRSDYPPALVKRLRELVAGGAVPAAELARLEVEIARLFASATRAVLAVAGVPAARVRALGCHGQTVYHGPNDETPVTMQLCDPNTVAEVTGIDTVADLRRRDLAAGGQGAPLAPALHGELFRTADEDRAVLNLGGIANLSLLPADPEQPVSGLDTGPGNCLLDAWIRERRGRDFDRDGEWAAGGRVDASLLASLRAEDYFDRPPPKSTGTETFHLAWARHRAKLDGPDPRDVQATLAELTAVTIADALRSALPTVKRLLVCGGGARNGWLLARLSRHLPDAEIAPTDEYGLPAEWVEAVLFATMARAAVDDQALDLTAVTGAARPHVFGAVYRA